MELILVTAILASILPFVPIGYLPLVAVALAAISYGFATKIKENKIILFIAIGLFIFLFSVSSTQKNQIDTFTEYFNEDQAILNVIVTDMKEDYYILRIDQVANKTINKGHNLLLFSQKEYKIGDTFSYKGEVRQFYQYKNPGTYYPYNKYVYKNYGYISENTGNLQITTTAIQNKDTKNISIALRQKILSRLETLDHKGSVLSLGVILGDRNQMDEQYIENFKNSGLIHITAVSGLHIGIVFMLFSFLVSKINSNKAIANIAGFLVALCFSIFVGLRPSTFRAIIMLLIFVISSVKGYPYSLSRSLQITALISIIWNPLVLWDMGFQFSYSAVLGIAYITPRLKFFDRITNIYIQNILKITTGVQIALLPLNYHNYRGVPLLSLLSNLLVAPILPIYLGLTFGYLILPLRTIKIIIEVMSHYILILSELTGVWLHISLLKILGFVGGCLILFLFLYKHNKLNKKKLMALTLIIIIAFGLVAYNKPQVEMYFLDVGQGDCIIIKHKGINILIDTGGSMGTKIGERAVVPALKYLGIKDLDYVFITHPHYDHMGALPEILEYGKIKNLLIPDNEHMYTTTYLNIINEVNHQINHIISIKKGDILTIGSLELDVLHPTPEYSTNESSSNNISLVMLLSYHNTTVLLTGDIESHGENQIHSQLEQVDVLKVAHHGSSTSTSKDFLAKTMPKHAIITVGNNTYGHPAPETLLRLDSINAQYHITKNTGVVTVLISKNGYKVKDYVR